MYTSLYRHILHMGRHQQAAGIWINGKRLNVGHNNWLALWQARLHRLLQPLLIWMDVLSIDQANHTERSSQVGLMGTISKAAMCVFVSAGADEDDSKSVVQEVLAHRKARTQTEYSDLQFNISYQPIYAVC
jgi:hypothetical protein